MLSMQSLDILFDLTEIKLNTIIVQDKDDLKEFKKLKECKRELIEAISEHMAKKKSREARNRDSRAYSDEAERGKSVKKNNRLKYTKVDPSKPDKKQNVAI